MFDSNTVLAVGAVIVMIWIVSLCIPMWILFGQYPGPRWWAFVPVWNLIALARWVGRPGVWGLSPFLGAVPIIGWIAAFACWLVLMRDLARLFGRGEPWWILLTFAPWFGFIVIGWGDELSREWHRAEVREIPRNRGPVR